MVYLCHSTNLQFSNVKLQQSILKVRNYRVHRYELKLRSQISTQEEQKIVVVPDQYPQDDWRHKARPIQPGSNYPAKQFCSQCGLCDTYYVAKVAEACAFLGDGMSKIEQMEPKVHGRKRDLQSDDELHFGVHEEMLYARNVPNVEGAQWTGIVTQVAIEMLESGQVDAVVCVQSDPNDRFKPKPVVARTPDDIFKARGVKPCLSPNLEVLATVEALNVKKLLFIEQQKQQIRQKMRQ
eukprot:TRINITY_DN48322_c1_g1_i3.p3 TRINITY_DN48322_c1_g1~~TRINITY_DN48322_c1_g1_i3.p3  ORF type:complete len:238 (-),score=19.55 TRINITY_DN48322_c1_g1_i3:58-771(-)